MAKKPALSPVASVTVTQASAPQTNIVSFLEAVRTESAKASTGSYGANREYAIKLISAFGQNFWRKASPKFKEWQEERARYDAALKELKHPNPSQAHSRLIDAADAICNPKEAKPRGKTALKDRAIKEAVALYRAILKENEKVGLDDVETRIFGTLKDYMVDGLKLDLGNLPK